MSTTMTTTAVYGSPETHPYRVGAIIDKTYEAAVEGASRAAASFDIALAVIDRRTNETVAIVMPDGEVVR